MVKIKRLLLIILSVIMVTGCSKVTGDTLKDFKDHNSKHETYILEGIMSIFSNEDEFKYDINVSVKDNEYYKVSLKNKNNLHEQIILKNEDGVYVITPDLNKSFKFTSNWPNNSSQSYIISSLVKDIDSCVDSKLEETKDGYKIKTKVNYPNNQKLDYELIYTDKKYNIKKVEVYNTDDVLEMSVDITNIKYESMDNELFELDNYVTDNNEEEECIKKCEKEDNECIDSCSTKETISNIDDIIYPLYLPNNTFLSGKDIVNTDNGNRVILTFEGTDPFILVEEVSKKSDEMNIIPVNGEPLFLSNTIGAISDNSLYFSTLGMDYYITSKTLSKDEMMVIAESIQNNTNLVAYTK